MPSVVVIDDHERFRAGIGDRLQRAGATVVGDAADAKAGIELVMRHRPDVVLMDLNMPRLSGVQATHELLRLLPAARIVILTISADRTSVAEAMLAGACGYVLKSAAISELMDAVRAAHAGETFLSPPVASQLLGRWRLLETASRIAPEIDPLLSPRELEVLRLIAAGEENAEIAMSLSISPNTVKRHVAAILTKLRTDNRTQAAVYAVREQLI